MNKNVWLLFACQAPMNAVRSGQAVMASVVGHRLSGRVRVQATHDLIVFRSVAMTAATSGAVQQMEGWTLPDPTAVPPAALAFIAVGWHRPARSRVAAA